MNRTYANGTLYIDQWGRTCRVVTYDAKSGFYITKCISWYAGGSKPTYTRGEDIMKNIIKEVFVNNEEE